MSSAPPREPGTQAPPAAPARPVISPPAAPPPSAVPTAQRHGRRPVLVALVLLAALAGAGWWLYSARPWLTAPGSLTASGTLEADEILIGSEVAGKIVGIAREGQPVRAGEVVASLDDSLPRLQFRQSDTATQQQLAIQLEKYQLHAPISGVVTRVPLHVGEVIAPGQVAVAVADLTSLDFTAYVLERDLGQVQVGQSAAVTADPFPGRTFWGVVTSIGQRAEFTPRNVQTQRDRLNLVFSVKIRVDNPDGVLKPGMPADATFAPLS
ncbi:MAG: efflux RND transporter periplasmic adaptor subunit [Chloroflexi bacterium]|nr:efflux RND transporter periplasmic adaptor subunit [Chloroflexota bacterium]